MNEERGPGGVKKRGRQEKREWREVAVACDEEGEAEYVGTKVKIHKKGKVVVHQCQGE